MVSIFLREKIRYNYGGGTFVKRIYGTSKCDGRFSVKRIRNVENYD